MAACILITLYVRDERSYDRWIPNAERLHRVHTRFNLSGGPILLAGTPGVLMSPLPKHYAEIEAATRLYHHRPTVTRGDDFLDVAMVNVDPSFFEVFDLPLVSGHRDTALADTASVILSQRMAQKLFGADDAMGRVFTINDTGRKRDHRVTGVIADLPDNTHLALPMIGLFDPEDFKDRPWVTHRWASGTVYTYLKLAQGHDASGINATLRQFEADTIPDAWVFGRKPARRRHTYIDFGVRPITQIHLRSKEGGQDLLYRLNTVEVTLPPLRERRDDIRILIEHFLHAYHHKCRRPQKPVPEDTYARLIDYAWPGNVRALRHAVERAVILSGGDRYEDSDFGLPATTRAAADRSADGDLTDDDLNLERMEVAAVKEALERNRYNISRAARVLGITRAALYSRMEKYGL